MRTTDVLLSAEERLHEIAAILAAGVLRLKTRSEPSPESPPCSPENTGEKPSESSRNCLDVSATLRTHVPAV